MPISPENRARYPADWRAAPLSEVVSPATVAARAALIAETGFDPATAPEFWERWVAQVVAGSVTPHKTGHDVDLGDDLRVEVKFSRAFKSRFNGRARLVFKWIMTKPQLALKPSHAVVLIGLHGDLVSTWALPASAARKSMTLAAPSDRAGSLGGSMYDGFAVPATDLLPALLRAISKERTQ